MSSEFQKKMAAEAALSYLEEGMIIGVGTGSTVAYFIEALASRRHKLVGAVASSQATAAKLQALELPLVPLNMVDRLALYVDGADEINAQFQMIKGGGAALTGEKLLAAVAQRFICIAEARKKVARLGKFPLPIEVIPMARSYVARELVKLGGSPVYREGVVTDYGNVILDVWNLEILVPEQLEARLNNIPGVVTNGLFAQRPADLLLLGTPDGVVTESRI